MKQRARNAMISCYIGTTILAFNPILAKSIVLSAITITFWRSFFATCGLFGFSRVRKMSVRIQPHHRIGLIVMGVLMSIHLVTFFYSIQTSTVAIGIISLYTFPAITALIEPFILKEKIRVTTFILAIVMVGAISIVVPEFRWDNHMTQGVFWGVSSALLYSIRNVMTRRYLADYSIVPVMGWQLTVSTIVLMPFMVMLAEWPIAWSDFGLLMVLGFVSTAIGHTLLASSFKHLSAAGAGLISAIQPVIAIALGYLILGETLTVRTFIGGVLVLGVVVVESMGQLSPSEE